MAALSKEYRESFEQIFKTNNPHVTLFRTWLDELSESYVSEMIATEGNTEYTLELKGQIRSVKFITKMMDSVQK